MKDKFGNDFKSGSLILAKLDQPYVIGRVVQTKPGGISLAGSDPRVKTPDVLIIACEFVASPPFNQNIMTIKEPEGNRITEN